MSTASTELAHDKVRSLTFTNMDVALSAFPDGLPSLDQLKLMNTGKGIPLETSWIWGNDDEVSPSSLWQHETLTTEDWTHQPLNPYTRD